LPISTTEVIRFGCRMSRNNSRRETGRKDYSPTGPDASLSVPRRPHAREPERTTFGPDVIKRPDHVAYGKVFGPSRLEHCVGARLSRGTRRETARCGIQG
jgi:hypothetical protein